MGALQIELTYRAPQETDLPALNSHFLRSMRKSPYTWGLDSERFFQVARSCWETVLREWRVLVAVPVGTDTEIAGYIAFRHGQEHHPCVAWLYVPRPYRRLGVASSLLAQAGIQRGVAFDVVFTKPISLRFLRDAGWRPCFTPFRSWELIDAEVVDEALAACPT